LRRQAEASGLDGRLHFLGVRGDMEEWMREAAVVLHTSRYEGLSNVLLEASLLGRPIVATRASGNDEIVADGQTGHLLPVGDVDGLVAAVRGLLDDPSAASGMGQRAAVHAAGRFSTGRMVDAWESLYLELLSRQRA
jgi:glycosyltransferase involved in cell wall biosynthesis